MKKILKCNLILLLIISNFVYSQNFSKLGSPFIKNYSIKDYKANPQNWGVIQDERGVFYIGNTSGILEFDGIEFNLIELENKSIVRDLAIDKKDGTIYVGGSGEIGYFAIDSIGKLKYVSLNRKLPRFERDFNDIYKVISTEKGVFFVSSYKIFHYFNDEIKIFATNSKANFAYDIYGDIFTINRYRGIFVIVDDNLALLPHSDIFSDHSGRIVMLPYGDKQILIATEKEGIYIYDLKRFYKEGIRQFNFYDKNIKKDILKKFPTEIDNFLEEHSLYCGEILDENTYAFGTLSNGIITMNKDGKFLQVINKKIGLASNTVLNLFKNKDKNLLVSLDRGFSIVEIKIPITLFSDLHGLDGSIYKAQKYKNNLYVGTSSGVYRLSKDTSSENKYISHFEKLKNVNTNCWDFIEFGNCLFGTQEKGVVCIEDSSVRLWHNLAEVIYCFGEKEMFPNHIFTGSADGLEAFEIKKNKFEKTKLINRYIFPEIRRTVRKIVSDDKENLWLTTSFDGIYRIKFFSDRIVNYEVKHFNISNGLPQNNFNYVHFINNKLLVSNSKGIYNLIGEGSKEKFVIDTSFIKVNYNSLGVSSIVLDKNKKYWLSTGKIGADRSIICEDGNKELSYSPMARIPRTDVSNFFIDENDILWIITNNALFRYDSKIKINEEKNFHVVFNRIKSKTDSIIFDCRFYNDKIKKRGYFTKFSVYQPKNLIPSIEYEDNSITIEYSATIFESDKIEFQYFLKGFDDEWSEWKKERKKEYTNLSEGSYIFKIRARNIFGTVSEISSLKFKIKSPWYRSVFAVIFYILFFVAFFFMGMRIYAGRLKRKNIELEKLIRERTLEISKQKDEINMRNHEITKKSKEVLWQTKKLEKINSDLTEKNKETNKQNKEMKDNIQYALITQKIILPNQKELNKEFENFVIFKAKNIISGDFYWFQKEKNKMFFAVADCSGHSINGGFITIIANHILTKVVKKDKVYDTNLILEKTYENFKKAIEEYKNIDEALIKIALICIEKLENNKTKISFSGAKLSLWYFNNENLKILKADRRSISIGGSYKKSNKIDFTKEEIILNKNDIIYFFTDGFLNQNAKNRKKFGSEKLKKILQKNINLPLYEQKEKLDAAFLRHKQEEEQRDDITVIAIKF